MQPTRRILMIAAAAAALAGPVLAAAPVVQPEDMSLGSAKAKIQVIEYASLACPHCAHFNAEVFPSLKAKWIDTGKVRYTLKEMLTEPVNVAAAGFLMARCAGPAKYFKVVDEVFKSQTQWTAGAKIKPILQQIAAANGLDEARFNACLQDDAAVQAVAARAQRAGEQDDVHQTPTIFINGKRIEPTPMTAADMDAALTAAAKGGK
ncbi:MAG TPA: DsbA family protein [Phenylobacterium sp.]